MSFTRAPGEGNPREVRGTAGLAPGSSPTGRASERRREAESRRRRSHCPGVRGVGLGEGRPPGIGALARERSRGALPLPSSSRESPRPPSALPG